MFKLGLGAIGPRHCAFELGPKEIEIDDRAQPFEAVAFRRQQGQPLLEVEKPTLPAHHIPPLPPRVNQIRSRPARFLGVSSC